MSNINTGINQLPVSNEIINGDYLIIDNGIETRRLDFKDFILGLSNVTFASTITSNYYNIAELSSYTLDTVSNIYADIDTLSSDIYTNIGAITANINTLSANVTTLSANVTTLSANTAVLSSNVTTLSSIFSQTPTAGVITASTHYIKIRINNTNYAIMLSATS